MAVVVQCKHMHDTQSASVVTNKTFPDLSCSTDMEHTGSGTKRSRQYWSLRPFFDNGRAVGAEYIWLTGIFSFTAPSEIAINRK
jgi:hypothetical protein